MFIVILKTENNRVAKYKNFSNEADALAHAEKFIGAFPETFVFNNVDNIPVPQMYVSGQEITLNSDL